MRSVLFALPFLTTFACTAAPQEAPPVQDASPLLTSARIVGPGDFQDPDCMVQYLGEVEAVVDDFRSVFEQGRDAYIAEYQAARADGADAQTLQAIRDEAAAAAADLRGALDATLDGLEADLCGEPTEPCDDPDLQDCCPYVGEDGACYDDYCTAYPDDPDCIEPCDPNDPQCTEPCDPATGEDCSEPCDPATGEDCSEPCDPDDPQCTEPCDPDDPQCADPCDADDPNCVN